MILESELLDNFRRDIPKYQAWGNVVKMQVDNKLLDSFGSLEKVAEVVKFSPEPRIKSENSLIEKAFYRGKRYEDPDTDITDKVGVRYVVLLIDSIKDIDRIIEENPIWTWSKDRDFEEERKKAPLIFDYQSDQYIVKNKELIEIDGIIIAIGTPCEIQVRTVLQHAYSELSHDIVYKSEKDVPPEIHRLFARSMAHIETTDELFSRVEGKMREIEAEKAKYFAKLEESYKLIGETAYKKSANFTILDAYWDKAGFPKVEDLKSFVDDPQLGEIIRNRQSDNFIYRQPVITLILYLISVKSNIARKYWPFQPDTLKLLFSDMGVRYD